MARIWQLSILVTVGLAVWLPALPSQAQEHWWCNYAPYDVRAVVLTQDLNTGSADHHAGLDIGPGNCRSMETTTVSSKRYLFYAHAIDSIALDRLRDYSAFRSTWSGMPMWFGQDVGLCVDEMGNFEYLDDSLACDESTLSGELSALPEAQERRVHNIIDPTLCSETLDCNSASLADLQQASFELNRSLKSSFQSLNPSDQEYGLIPYAVGFDVLDSNGPFKKGVKVTVAWTETPLGSPIVLERDDIVLYFNATPIYEREAFFSLIISHAQSAGYSVPASVVFSRNGQLYETSIYQFFHSKPWRQVFQNADGSCKRSGNASLVGLLEESSFYLQSTLSCLDSNLNVNSGCQFRVNQLVAAYKQFCPDETFYSTFAGGLFLPGRDLAESGLRRFVFSSKTMSTRVIRNVMMEGVEEAVRSSLTLPPGVVPSASVSSILANARTAGLMGAGFTILMPRTK